MSVIDLQDKFDKMVMQSKFNKLMDSMERRRINILTDPMPALEAAYDQVNQYVELLDKLNQASEPLVQIDTMQSPPCYSINVTKEDYDALIQMRKLLKEFKS